MKRQLKAALYSGVALSAALAATPVVAQEITSQITGSVADASGAPAVGVDVIVVHVPSGSRVTRVTNEQGNFVARGLRPGGPYTVEIVGSDRYTGQTLTNVFLNVGQALPLRLSVAADGGSVEEIAVTAERVAQTLQGAGSTTYTAESIRELPSISRDFYDFIRLNPFVSFRNGQVSFAGANNRLNSIVVDGVQQDDVFGLNGSGVPTQRSPLSNDAIEQVGASPAPFDVENGQFQGGLINVVTKSGTNEFHGTAFYQFRDEGLAGDRSDGRDVDLGDFEEEFYGASLGGPIIKDKLFFFLNYEKFDRTSPNLFGAEGSGRANEIPGVSQADADRIRGITQDRYGFDPLSADVPNLEEEDEKIFAKIDWNINENHRAFFSFQQTEGNEIQFTGNSQRDEELALESHFYDRSEDLTAYNFQVFSDWTDNFSTEMKVAYREQVTGQVSRGGLGFGDVQVFLDPDQGVNGPSVNLGPDQFRHANELNSDTWQVKLQGDYLTGDHNISFGYEFSTVDVFNLFVPSSLGVWQFLTIDDYEAGIADTFTYSNAPTGNPIDGAANFSYQNHVAYIQDRWTVNDRLTLTGGIRFETFVTDDEPAENQFFVDRNGFTNTTTIDGESLILPRFSFDYQIDDRQKVRGGAGLFAGGDPLVWISNNFSTDGVTVGSFEVDRATASAEDIARFLDNQDPTTLPAGVNDRVTSSPVSTVNAIDPDFDLPSVWRFNIAYERFQDLGFLGDDWKFTLEAIWSETEDAPLWTELRRRGRAVGIAPDGSPIYGPQGGDDVLLTNTSEGRSASYAISAEKQWENFSFFGAYTYSDVDVVNPATSSRASSNFEFVPHTDRNDVRVGRSQFEIRHDLTLVGSYRKKFFGDNETIFTLAYNGRSGRPFSLTFDEFLQFGGTRDADAGDSHLLYVPTTAEVGIFGVDDDDPTKTVLLDGITEAEFNEFIDELGLERGQTVDRNGERASWVDQLDLRIAQEVPVGFGKIELWMDMENVLNFIDSDMGNIDEPAFATIPVVDLDVEQLGGQTKFVYSDLRDPTSRFTLRPEQSVWRIQFGVRYRF
ncbi:TonB-dependent receptor [Eilatimonas milleporae]|uniref:Carboxypeptidase family protein n=1 Tax=Eilatimonas milleporae TaxID=911205 RepID=A0A3M0D077_9PROT|nr:carboxypeptidase regulatory-like domain-containing protein [Eilatimonas milleporae]RMB13066.1 carboxypeptidase family protein [Eilatimonas milleporae]